MKLYTTLRILNRVKNYSYWDFEMADTLQNLNINIYKDHEVVRFLSAYLESRKVIWLHKTLEGLVNHLMISTNNNKLTLH